MSNNTIPTVTLSLDDLQIICKIAAQGITISRAAQSIKENEDVDKWQIEKDCAIRQISEYVDEYTIKGDPTVHRIVSDDALDLIETLGE